MFTTSRQVGRAIRAAAGLACLAVQANAAPVPTRSTTIPGIVARGAAAYAGAPAPDAILHLVVSLPQRNIAELDAFLADITNPDSANFRHYLTVAEFTRRFGPTQADYYAAVQFFAAQGLTVAARSANRTIIDVDGRVADIERAFHVKMGLYRHPTENRLFFAPDRAPTLDLAVPIEQVLGLDDFVKPYAKYVRAKTISPRGGSGPGGQFTGRDMRKAYYPTGTLTGHGQSVGLMELAGYNIKDVQAFFSNGYGPANRVPVVGIKTDSLSLSCTGSCDDSEQALDIEYAISIAPDLASVRVYVGSSPEDVLNRMATDNISKVLSTSWGWNEAFKTDDAIFKEFAAQGQTNLTASGDFSSLATSGPWPEEDANIIAVGGTDVATKTAGGLWSAETGWSGSAGGPSLDKTIKIEAYQKPFVTAANGGSTTLRNVPDIAANADTDMEICADGKCSGSNGGTSFASPMWAGFIALANQQALDSGKPVLGFINPMIYKIAGGTGYPSIFHDETKGKSGIYSCTLSYDLVTGLGSPHGANTIKALIDAD
jgi:subtilase family serine protease